MARKVGSEHEADHHRPYSLAVRFTEVRYDRVLAEDPEAAGQVMVLVHALVVVEHRMLRVGLHVKRIADCRVIEIVHSSGEDRREHFSVHKGSRQEVGDEEAHCLDCVGAVQVVVVGGGFAGRVA